ncbi:lytic polysaccharide monooxygenase [Carnobacterium gallinarum]|uniref:lytic polysaccharide monooxygenase n=1 Tax=Carnobacterium gallinarum TaxID=2749 RepID=UPI0005579B24|nr:lytic polysaccharide monooxygenase [Carnobacterium gallinarum]
MKNRLVKLVLVVALLVGGLAAFSASASAHGYVSSPGSRAYKGSNLGGNLNTNVGQAQWEPQSIEAPKGTFITGKLASAGLAQFSLLDEQTATRWHKSNISNGPLSLTWTLTARHSTANWQYYMTKKGWNPNQPLDIKNFDLIGQVNDNGAIPSSSVTHNVTVPTDREGYNVILAVWTINDTTNAFYQAIDVNVVK